MKTRRVTDYAHCQGLKADGSPCGVQAPLGPTGFCWMHDPERRAEATAIRRQGAATTDKRRRARPPGPPETMAEAAQYAAWATWAVACGKISPNQATSIAANIGRFEAALKASALEEQVTRLQEQVQELKGKRGAS